MKHKTNIRTKALLLLLFFSHPLYASIQLDFSPLDPSNFSAATGTFIKVRLAIQNTSSESVNNINLSVQWENTFSRPPVLASSQLNAQLINNTLQSSISSLPANTTQTLDFKTILALCTNPQLTASATDELNQTVTISQTINCETRDPNISLKKTIPDAMPISAFRLATN